MPREHPGFALIVAMLLMGFVLLVLLSLSLYSSVELGTSAQNIYRQQARENARLGVFKALGELQRAAGHDQRVTARAEILDTRINVLPENRFWTGVWEVEEDNLLDYSDSELDRDPVTGNISSTTEDAGSTNLTWLISHEEGTDIDPTQELTNTQPVFRYWENDDYQDIEAGLVNATIDGAISGKYAWWVSDEGVKAKVNTRDRSQEIATSNSAQERLKQALPLMSARKTNPAVIDKDEEDVLTTLLPINSSMIERIQTEGSFQSLVSDQLPVDEAEAFSKKHILNLTYHSAGVLSDTLHGGLKLDLTRGLDDQWQQFLQKLEPDSANWTSGDSETGWPEPQSIFKTDWPDGFSITSNQYKLSADTNGIWGPYWDILYQYYNLYKPNFALYPEMIVGVGNNELNYRFLGYAESTDNHDNISDVTDLSPEIEPRGAGPAGGINDRPQLNDSGFFIPTPEFSNHRVFRGNWFGLPKTIDLDRGLQHTDSFRREPLWNALTPVMVRAQLGFGISTFERAPRQIIDGKETRYYGVRLHFYPAVVLWNPYNVKLTVKDYRLTIEPHMQVQIWDTPVYGESNSIDPVGSANSILNGAASVPGKSTNFYSNARLRGYPLDALINENAWGTATKASTESFDPRAQTSTSFFGGVEKGLDMNFLISQAEFGPGDIKIFGLSGGGDDDALSSGDIILTEGASLDSGVFVELYQTNEQNRFQNGSARIEIPPIEVTFEPDSVDPGTYLASPDKTYYFKFYVSAKDSLQQWGGSQIDFNLSMLDESALSSKSKSTEVDVGGGLNNAKFFDETSDFIDKRGGLFAFPIGGSAITATTASPPRVTAAQKLMIMDWRLKGTNFEVDGVPVISQFSPRRMVANRLYSRLESPFPETLFGQFYEHHLYEGGEEYPVGGTDDILNPSTNGSYAYWGKDSTFNSETQVILFDVPRQPLQSVGSLMHANLSFYDTMPAYAIGNSYASPYIPLDTVSDFKSIDRLDSSSDNDYVFADYSYLLNMELFDRYFFSTVPPDYRQAQNSAYQNLREKLPPFEAVDVDFLEAGKPLPNSAIKYFSYGSETTEDTLDRLQGSEALTTSASRLMVDGAFNVNSTSVAAWKAFLGGTAFADGQTLVIDSVTSGTQTISNDDLDAPISRFGAPRASNSGSGWQWRGFRSLNDAELTELAESIVEEVKKRGPFPSMADFVNRRLVDGELGLRGALQAAIDNSTTNNDGLFSKTVTESGEPTSLYGANGAFINNTTAAQAAGIPGWISQNDILRIYGPLMTVRSDTFLIRAYGEATDPFTNKARAKAWCEVVVQRMPEFIKNEDEDGDWADTSVSSQAQAHSAWISNNELAEDNKLFGRRFEVVSFRWLNEDEI